MNPKAKTTVRRRTKPIYVIVGDAISFVGKDRVLDLESETEPDEPLCEELQCPIADEILVALRKAFTLSYPQNPLIEGLSEALAEIRRVCVEALIDIPEVLEDIGLPPIPPVIDDKRINRAKVFIFFLARASDLRINVRYEGTRRSLFKLLEPDPADALIRVARETVTLTFSEMHNEDQHAAVLKEIRNNIWSVLPEFNEYLVAIEAEPIAPKPDDI